MRSWERWSLNTARRGIYCACEEHNLDTAAMIELAQYPVTEVRKSALQVLETEAEALNLLARNIPHDFEPAVNTILGAKGRVIVSGIGKSGHIGRKIAATLTSTGTPANFVHAAEASHGDLGMITREDVCLLLSNSGETSELRDILGYATRFSIPIIAISGKLDSALMHAADCRLLLPPAPEACPNGLAPTTSTTLMIALGDALAVALMEARGFRPEHFRELHPGGRLGAQMTQVSAVMHGEGELPLVCADAPMSETLLVMTSKGFGVAIIVSDEGTLIGVVTDGDLRRNMENLMQRTAGEIATRSPITVRPEDFACKVLARMNEHEVSVVPVVDENRRAIGILHIHDLLRAGVA